jgi:hypothetical protein
MRKLEILRHARRSFSQRFAQSVSRAHAASLNDLLAAADAAESARSARTLLDARLALQTHADELEAGINRHLQRLLDRSFETAYNRNWRPFALSIPSGPLSLRDTTQIEQELMLEALTTRLRKPADDPLKALNRRIANLFNEDEVRERENPFRPYLLTAAIANACRAQGLLHDIQMLITPQLVERLRDETPALYQQLNANLAELGISDALPLTIRKGPDTIAPFAGPPTQPRPPTPLRLPLASAPTMAAPVPESFPRDTRSDLLMRWVQLKTRSSVERVLPGKDEPPLRPSWLDETADAGKLLRRVFGRRPAEPGNDEPVPMASYSGSTLLMSAIHQLEGTGDRSGSIGGSTARNRILEHRGALSRLTDSPEERRVIDLVSILFEFVLRDGHVPEDIKAQLCQLQFRMLRQGLFDPQLFSRPQHPARELFNRIGSVSISLDMQDAAAAALRDKVSDVIRMVADAPGQTAAPFEAALAALDDFLDHQLPAADAGMQQVALALREAEGWTVRSTAIATHLQALITDAPLDDTLVRFLLDDWPLVIERAGRSEPAIEHDLRGLVPGLIWSTLPKRSNTERTELLRQLPRLSGLLSQGLAVGQCDASRQEAFMDWLVKANVAALRAADDATMPSLIEWQQRFRDFLADSTTVAPATTLSALPHSTYVTEALGQFNAKVSVLDEEWQAFQRELPVPEFDSTDVARALTMLRAGIAIEVMMGGAARKCRLTWISPRRASLLLRIDGVPLPAVLSTALFRTLMLAGEIRFLENEPLFERTVSALLQTADEMDRARQDQPAADLLVPKT